MRGFAFFKGQEGKKMYYIMGGDVQMANNIVPAGKSKVSGRITSIISIIVKTLIRTVVMLHHFLILATYRIIF